MPIVLTGDVFSGPYNAIRRKITVVIMVSITTYAELEEFAGLVDDLSSS